VLLTLTTTKSPARDFGYLLHKHPDRVHAVDLPFGTAHVFYPERGEDRCTAALLVELITATPHRCIRLDDVAAVAEATAWWHDLVTAGGEGMVVKPLSFVAHGRKGLVQPALKCRGPEYLRIVYGPEYLAEEHLTRLRQRAVASKRSLSAGPQRAALRRRPLLWPGLRGRSARQRARRDRQQRRRQSHRRAVMRRPDAWEVRLPSRWTCRSDCGRAAMTSRVIAGARLGVCGIARLRSSIRRPSSSSTDRALGRRAAGGGCDRTQHRSMRSASRHQSSQVRIFTLAKIPRLGRLTAR